MGLRSPTTQTDGRLDVEQMVGVAVRIQLEGLAHAFGYEYESI
jgi:hypothetical protein